MTDSTAELLLAKMRGDGYKPSRMPERPVEPLSQEMFDHMRGGSERDTRRAQAEQHNRDYRAKRSFEARVQKRTRELVDRHEGGQYPEHTAREQLRREDAQAHEQAERKREHEARAARTRRESEANRTENLREKLRKPSAKKRGPSFQELIDNAVAEALGKTKADSQETADAALVAGLQAVTGAHR